MRPSKDQVNHTCQRSTTYTLRRSLRHSDGLVNQRIRSPLRRSQTSRARKAAGQSSGNSQSTSRSQPSQSSQSEFDPCDEVIQALPRQFYGGSSQHICVEPCMRRPPTDKAGTRCCASGRRRGRPALLFLGLSDGLHFLLQGVGCSIALVHRTCGRPRMEVEYELQ